MICPVLLMVWLMVCHVSVRVWKMTCLVALGWGHAVWPKLEVLVEVVVLDVVELFAFKTLEASSPLMVNRSDHF